MLAVALYAILFGAALWMLRAQSPMFHRPAAGKSAPAPAKRPAAPRPALLAGEGLARAARDDYFRQLSAECCTCGCDLNLRDCLLSDQACTRSPELSYALLQQLR